MEQNNVQSTVVDETTDVTSSVTTNENVEDDLFDDSIVEDTNETKEEIKDESKVEETKEEKPFSFRVKYNGEEKDLNEDETREFAQKGMNYDHIFEPLHRLAKQNGLKVEEYLDKLNEVEFEKNVSEQLDSLKEQYPETPEEVLNELAQKRVKETYNLQEKKFEEENKSHEEDMKAEVQRQVELFRKEFPDVDTKTLDNKVLDYIKDGYSLLEAYSKWTREQEIANRPIIEAKEKVDKLNEENKKKSLGNTTNAGSEEPDDFFVGFNSI